MTVKQFFTSQAFKCIIVLLIIALIAGGLLAILNDVLFVTEEERTMRAIEKVYGKEMQYEELIYSSNVLENEFGTINKLYKLENGNYLVQTTGGQGYKGGTITVWVVLATEYGDFAGIEKVVLESYEKQTLMSKLTYDVYSAHNDEITGDVYFTTSGDGIKVLISGATYSTNALNNAVDCALKFAREVLFVPPMTQDKEAA